GGGGGVLRGVAYAAGGGGSPEPAMAGTAVELPRQLGDPEAFQDAAYVLLFLLAGPDHLAEREALARDAKAEALAAGTMDPTVIGLLDVASDRLVQCDTEGARRWRVAADEGAGGRPPPAR